MNKTDFSNPIQENTAFIKRIQSISEAELEYFFKNLNLFGKETGETNLDYFNKIKYKHFSKFKTKIKNWNPSPKKGHAKKIKHFFSLSQNQDKKFSRDYISKKTGLTKNQVTGAISEFAPHKERDLVIYRELSRIDTNHFFWVTKKGDQK